MRLWEVDTGKQILWRVCREEVRKSAYPGALVSAVCVTTVPTSFERKNPILPPT